MSSFGANTTIPNMMFTLIVSIVFTLLSLTAASESKCERELEAVVYTPPNVYYDYLLRLEKQFRQFAPVMFTPQNATSVFSFINTYGIDVAVTDAFGYNWYYGQGYTTIGYSKIDNFLPCQVRAMTVGRGFMKFYQSTVTLYSFRIFNAEGKYLLITFTLPIVKGSG